MNLRKWAVWVVVGFGAATIAWRAGNEVSADDPWEAINLKDVEMKFIVQKIADWTDKVVIPADEILKEKITIYAPGRLRRREALAQIYGAMRIKGFAAEETATTIYLRPISDARLGLVPTVGPEQPLIAVENKEQIVQKFFRLASYSPGQMAQIVQPLIGEYGYVSADETTGNLLVIDTVGNLMRIETIIAQFDVPAPEQIATEVFEIRHRDPGEVVQLLQVLLPQKAGRTPSPKTVLATRGILSVDNRLKSRTKGKDYGATAASSVVVGGPGSPILLVPEPKFSWVIAKARPEDMEEIRRWIERLDRPVPTIATADILDGIENGNQVVQKFVRLAHYDPVRMSEIVAPLLSESGHVTAEESTRTLLLIDTVENLIRIESVVAQFDVPETELVATEIIEVRQRGPEEIIHLLETIFSGSGSASTAPSYSSRHSYNSRSHHGGTSRTRFTSGASRAATSARIAGSSGRAISLVPEARQGWIIAKASPDDIAEIRQWVERLDRAVTTITDDVPLSTIENRNQVVQKCIHLESYSPGRMGEIVLPLLSESGYVSADESTGNLLVIDTVENLIRVEAIVAQFDVPEAEQTATQIFDVRYVDPSEAVQLLRMLLSDGGSRSGAGYARRSSSSSRSYPLSSRLYRGGLSNASANSVVVGPSSYPVVLIPEPKRKWIIARASAEDMQLISDWIGKLDQAEPVNREYEAVPITYADVREVAVRINEALQQMVSFRWGCMKRFVVVGIFPCGRHIPLDRRPM